MKILAFLCLITLSISNSQEANAMPVRSAGGWSVAVGPGSVLINKRSVKVPHEVTIKVTAPEVITIRDEMHGSLPLFNSAAGGWMKGVRLDKLITQECSATGLLAPDSVVVKSSAGASTQFVLGKDYQLDPLWATLGRLPDGQIKPDQPVYIDYIYNPSRLDSIVVGKDGKVMLVEGKSAVECPMPPSLPVGTVAIANIWLPGPIKEITDENIFPIEVLANPALSANAATAARTLPKTLAKLRAGGQVTVVAWGDSVTAGGGAAQVADWYQNQFLNLLQKRYPKATIILKTAAWPGGNSQGYLDSPADAPHNYQRDVLDPKPDLVTIEFVNDSYINEAQTIEHYTGILKRLHEAGAEVILITPHLVRPDWLGVSSLKFDKDPRPYVQGLHTFAAKENIALADASAGWLHLWREGIPYVTLLANSINHPDSRGHMLFARTLIDLFPR